MDDKYEATEEEFRAWHDLLQENGVKIVAPPMWMLVEMSSGGDTAVSKNLQIDNFSSELGIAPFAYTMSAKEHGLDIITWTLERTGPGLDGWYWQTLQENDLTDGDKFALLHVLSHDCGVLGVFSDWPATTTFFANCMGLGLRQDVVAGEDKEPAPNAEFDTLDTDEKDKSSSVLSSDYRSAAVFAVLISLLF